LLDSLRIGAAMFRGVSGVTFDRTSLHGDTNVPRGVVGFPVFHELLETIDFPAATLRLTRSHLPAADGVRVVDYRAPNAIPMIPISVAGEKFEAHLDTGSPSFLSIPEKDSSRVHFAEPLREVGRGRTVGGAVVFRGAKLDGALVVGAVTWDHPLVMLN